ncbi:MAG: glycosyltransferase [Gammaproteobacteria bacterium]|nr:glycosyltransferase [Gammaproteobacteria bacterium]
MTRKFKVGVYLEQSVTAGGGYQQSINAIEQLSKVVPTNSEIKIFTPIKQNLVELEKIDIESSYLPISRFDKLYTFLCRSQLFFEIQSKLRLLSNFEKKMIKEEVDLVYFLSPSGRAIILQKLNYVFTLWDMCHRDHLEFPEVREFGEFERRELTFKRATRKAYITLVDAEISKKKLIERYGVDEEKIIVMPFSPSIHMRKNKSQTDLVLSKYKLKRGYYFYPAQFWPHKNHYIILEALKKLAHENVEIKVVFSGSDKGNYEAIMKKATDLGVDKNITYLGFVDSEELFQLYENCIALIMPTYFGPTNLPPYEAWLAKTLVLYPKEHIEQVTDAAILFDNDSPDSLAQAIKKSLNVDERSRVIEKSLARVSEVEKVRAKSEQAMKEKLNKYCFRSLSWK